MKSHPVPTFTHSTTKAVYEYGSIKVEVTDTTVNGDAMRSVRIINKSSKAGTGPAGMDLDGPVATDLKDLLRGLDL